MKFYYAPGACSLAAHIVLHEAGITAEYEKVDTKTKVMEGGGDFRTINPKGAVPTLRLDDGEILTEGPVIMQYIADQAPASGLAPASGTLERYRLHEWLNFIASELHKPCSLLFNAASDPERDVQRRILAPKLDYLEGALAGRSYLMGEQFGPADAYLYNLLLWVTFTGTDLGSWPAVQAFRGRVAGRPAVEAALREEGLLPTQG